MGGKRRNGEAFTRWISEKVERAERAAANALAYVGEEAVSHARSYGSYQDQTGNLRSSIQCGVSRNGQLLHSSRPEPIKDGGEGAASGRAMVRELASRSDRNIRLDVVAAQRYALYVETRRDVLTSAEIMAKSGVVKRLRESGLKVW